MKCITVLYPAKDNDSFDFDFYLRRHVPLIQDILGKSLHRMRVTEPAVSCERCHGDTSWRDVEVTR